MDTETQKEHGPVRTGVEDGVMWPKAKENPGATRAGRGGKDPPPEPWRETSPAATLIADL